MIPDVTEWAVPGATVVVVVSNGMNDTGHLRRIERLTKTLVVLNNGDRFKRATMDRWYGSSWSATREYLLHPQHPKAKVAVARAWYDSAQEHLRKHQISDERGKHTAAGLRTKAHHAAMLNRAAIKYAEALAAYEKELS